MEMKNEIIDKIAFILIKNGVENADQIKNEIVIALRDYSVIPAERSVVVYTQGKNEVLLKKFLIGKTVAGCSERTVRMYQQEIQKILERIGKDVDTIEAEDIRYYFALRARDGVAKTTINNERRFLSSFFTYLIREELISKNPMLKIDPIKTTKIKKPAFTSMEIEQIRAACRSKRESAMIEILLSTGCRVSEVCGAKISDVEDGKMVVHGKGDKYRTTYLNARAQFALERYLSERTDDSPYLFAKSTLKIGDIARDSKEEMRNWWKKREYVADEPMDSSSMESTIRKIGKRAGVEKTHPHRFRRTCATFALRRGMPIEQVSKMLGHEQVNTTMIYLDLSEQDLENAHRKYVT